jgi:serine/threonine protein kinase
MAIRYIRRTILCTAIFLSIVALAQEGRRAQSVPPNLLPYDLLLRGGHLLDDKNKIDAVRDVGIKDGKVAAVAEHLEAKDALKTIDVTGFYVTPECLVGSARGLFTVMEYCPDGDYRDVLSSAEKRKLSTEELVGHMRQVLKGLKSLHSRTVHRDLKPENILVSGEILKIGDFGLAKFVDEATRTYKGSGTPRCMAPEVWTGQRAVPATDLYALGVMFFEAVCGKAPFQASNADSLRDMHLYTPVPRPKSVNANILDLLDGIIKKLLSKPIQDRYQTADEGSAESRHCAHSWSIHSQDLKRLLPFLVISC